MATYASATGNNDQLIANIVVKSTGTVATSRWTVTWTWPTGEQKVVTFYNADVQQNGKRVTAVNAIYDGVIAPGRSITFGISGKGKAAQPVPVLTCTAS